MKLTIVGNSGSLAGPDSAASCYLIEAEAGGRIWRMILELGSGAIGPLQRFCDPALVDLVVISHGHADHCADLGALSVLRRYGPQRDAGLPRIPLFGPRGLDHRVLQIAGDSDGDDLSVFDYTALDHGARIMLGPFDITVSRAWHPVPALAYRIEGPSPYRGRASLAFTGDTDRTAEIDELSRGVDVLLTEAGWAHRTENPEGIHMSGDQAGSLAAASGATKTVVTHIAAWVDPAETMAQVRKHVPDAVYAEPGHVYEF